MPLRITETTMTAPPRPTQESGSDETRASIERRREALRRIGRTGAAAGAATPLAALATGGRQWVRHKTNTTKKVHASVSGCNSVVMSAQPTKETYGKPCGSYDSSWKIPTACGGDKRFDLCFDCGGKDSNGVSNGAAGCLFQKTISQLCKYHPNSFETAWATAYCNAGAFYPSCKFPYSMSQVRGLWAADTTTRTSAYSFFKTFMMNG